MNRLSSRCADYIDPAPGVTSTEAQSAHVEALLAELIRRCQERAKGGEEADAFDVYRELLSEQRAHNGGAR